jgi:DNA-binding transcriptional LysR family regulator
VISKTISDLEHALGVRLLDRTARGIEPTEYGRAFINCGTVVFDELRRGVQAIEFLTDPTFGEVRIGGAAPFIDEMIPAVIARLAKQYPRIEFHVTESDTPTLCELLRGRIDLVIGRTSMAFGEDLVSDPLFEDRMFLVAGTNNPWSRDRIIELAALVDEPWVMPEADITDAQLGADATAGVDPSHEAWSSVASAADVDGAPLCLCGAILVALHHGQTSIAVARAAWRHRARTSRRGFGQVAQAFGVAGTSASVGTIISATIPVFVVVFAAIRLRQSVAGWQRLGLLAAFCGIALVAMDGRTTAAFQSSVIGATWMLLSALAIAFYFVWSVELTRKYGTGALAAWSTFFGLLALMPWAGWEAAHTPFRITALGIASAFYMGAVVTVAGLFLWLNILRTVPASTAASVQYL